MSISIAAGLFGRPGMVIIGTIATKDPAPAFTRISLIGKVKPVGT